MKILYYDTETTGKDSKWHCIHEIGGYIEVDGKIVDEFEYKMRPHPMAKISADALAYSKKTYDEVMAYEDPQLVHRRFKGTLGGYVDVTDPNDKYFLCGYNNAKFDDGFLQAHFTVMGDPTFRSFFHSAPLDVMILANFILRAERQHMPNFQLGTVAKRFNVDYNPELAHNAKYDALVAKEIYQQICRIQS